MKPAYRALWMCRKTLTAESQSGASNVSTSDPFRVPEKLCETHPARKMERFCPVEQLDMAKCAALSPFDSLRVSPKRNGRADARSWWTPGRSRSMRSTDVPPSRACGAACRGVLTAMWDGGRDEAGPGWRFRISSSGNEDRRSVHRRRTRSASRHAGGPGVGDGSHGRRLKTLSVVSTAGTRFKPFSVSIPGMPGLLDCAWSRLS